MLPKILCGPHQFFNFWIRPASALRFPHPYDKHLKDCTMEIIVYLLLHKKINILQIAQALDGKITYWVIKQF